MQKLKLKKILGFLYSYSKIKKPFSCKNFLGFCKPYESTAHNLVQIFRLTALPVKG